VQLDVGDQRATMLRQRGPRTIDQILALHAYARDRGRFSEANQDLDNLAKIDAEGLWLSLWLRIQNAVYAGADSVAAAAAVKRLEDELTTFERSDTSAERRRATSLMWIAQWRMLHGSTRGVREAITLIRRLPPPLASDVSEITLGPGAAVLLEAQLAKLEGRADAGAHLARLDSLLREGEPIGIRQTANLAVARLHEARGNLVAALDAVGRRPREVSSLVLLPLASYLREEGRLAALVGDTTGAIYAYRHYLALRANAEPPVQQEVEAVRAALASLERANAR
jgi:hypothetical protein